MVFDCSQSVSKGVNELYVGNAIAEVDSGASQMTELARRQQEGVKIPPH